MNDPLLHELLLRRVPQRIVRLRRLQRVEIVQHGPRVAHMLGHGLLNPRRERFEAIEIPRAQAPVVGELAPCGDLLHECVEALRRGATRPRLAHHPRRRDLPEVQIRRQSRRAVAHARFVAAVGVRHQFT